MTSKTPPKQPTAQQVIDLLNDRWPGTAWISRHAKNEQRRLTIDIPRRHALQAVDLLQAHGADVNLVNWEEAHVTLSDAFGRLTSQANRTDGARLIALALKHTETLIGTPVLPLLESGRELPDSFLATINWDMIAATDDEHTSRWALVAVAETIGQALKFASDVTLTPEDEVLTTLLIDLRRETIDQEDTWYNFHDQLVLVDLAIASELDLLATARTISKTPTVTISRQTRTNRTVGR